MYAGRVAGPSRSRFVVTAIAFLLIASACASPTVTVTPLPSLASPAISPYVTVSAEPTSAVSNSATPTPAPSQTQTGTFAPSATDTATPSATAAIPAFRHIYVIVLENKEYGSIVGPGRAPYLNQLIARYGLATNFYAETHPSEPNYIAMTSGDLQGTRTDGTYNLAAASVFDQVEAAGRTWRVYAQGYPGSCFKGSIATSVSDGPGAAGEYVRKHNPAISYTAISRNPARCARIVGLAGFDPAAADLEFIVPNLINDMHSSSVAVGDTFLAAFVPRIVDAPAFANSVLFITWDEGISSVGGGGHIATVVVSPGMTPGSRSATRYTHYSLLRTIEQAWGMPLLGRAATAAPIALPY